ncbi:50S ribosomal protein L9, partial [Alphaproteobacteria bacterium]|nr:50S ribosomal protein L9 [Alphaproteobacteria bacterium]
MNIILLEKIKKLGDIGDEVTVKSGYARNFLVPNKKALYATPENRKYFEEKKTEIKTQNENLIKDAKEKLKKISGQEVLLIRAASDTGQLFGSVSTKDIVNSLAKKNIVISKNEIDLNKSIKNLTYEKIIVNLHPEVSCEIILNVARSSEEASTQKQLGKAITGNSENEDDQRESSQKSLEKNKMSKDEHKDKKPKTDYLNEKNIKTEVSDEFLKTNENE